MLSAEFLLAGLVGCTRSQTETVETTKRLVGLWEDSEETWIFHNDGTFRVDEQTDSNISGSSGSWLVENDILHIHFGFGSTGQDLEIRIKIEDEGESLVFNEQRKLTRNHQLQRQSAVMLVHGNTMTARLLA